MLKTGVTDFENAHNTVLQTAAEAGIPGALLYGCVFLTFLGAGLRVEAFFGAAFAGAVAAGAVVVVVEAAGAAVVVAAALPRAGIEKARATARPRAERRDFFMASFPSSCRSR